MYNKIQKSKRFAEECEKFETAINKMPDSDFKAETRNLFLRLVKEVKKMDNMYEEMVYTKQLPTMGNDFRETITSIRKELDKRLKNYIN